MASETLGTLPLAPLLQRRPLPCALPFPSGGECAVGSRPLLRFSLCGCLQPADGEGGTHLHVVRITPGPAFWPVCMCIPATPGVWLVRAGLQRPPGESLT